MDLKANVLSSLKVAVSHFIKDLEALPEEAVFARHGGTSRSAADIAYETALVNDEMRAIIVGEAGPVWPEEEWTHAPEAWKTKAEVVAFFSESADKLVALAESFKADEFEVIAKSEKSERTRFERFQFAAMHTMYHCAQLNFIQSMLGDGEMHWG